MMPEIVSSLIGGRAREDAPGGTLEISNPARLAELVAVARLADATTFVEACAAARKAQRDCARAGARAWARDPTARPPGRGQRRDARPDHDPRDREADRPGPRRGPGWAGQT